MAYVVARKSGRFEIRESVLTDRGPRARSLANFGVLTEAVISKAHGRSSRTFDRQAVLASATRCGAPIEGVRRRARTGSPEPRTMAAFVDSSRRFAQGASQWRPARQLDHGAALADLLRFADEVGRHQQHRRRTEPLAFPVLAKLVRAREPS